MSYRRKFDKLLWKFFEYAHKVSWYVLGDLPFTWDMKHKRNMAYIRYVLHTESEVK